MLNFVQPVVFSRKKEKGNNQPEDKLQFFQILKTILSSKAAIFTLLKTLNKLTLHNKLI